MDYITGDAFTLQRTGEGWWITTPAPSDLSRYYPRLYYGDGARRFPGFVECLQRWLYRRRARFVSQAARRVGRVLDVGCGPGHLLAQFRALGWTVLGTEGTEKAASIPRERYGFEVRAAELQELGLPDADFDAVVSWHTLEHMREPGQVLDEFARVLKPGGVLFLSVPDFTSLEAQTRPAAWFHLDVPRHLCHFPARVLQEQLTKRGFVIECESRCAPEYDVFSLVQTWQNRWGLPHNLLYLMLKSARALTIPRATWIQRATAAVAAVAIFPVAFVLAAWRAWRRTGAVVTVLARKTTGAELRSTGAGLN